MTQELRKLAEAATQGKWKSSGFSVNSKEHGWATIANTEFDYDGMAENAAYIAAANPAAILSLLDRLEKAEKDAERCKRFIDAMCEETFDTWTNGYRMQQVAMNIQHSMNITAAMEASK